MNQHKNMDKKPTYNEIEDKAQKVLEKLTKAHPDCDITPLAGLPSQLILDLWGPLLYEQPEFCRQVGENIIVSTPTHVDGLPIRLSLRSFGRGESLLSVDDALGLAEALGSAVRFREAG